MRLLTLLIWFAASCIGARQGRAPGGTTEAGLTAFDKAVRSVGGAGALEALSFFTVTASGETYWGYEGASPGDVHRTSEYLSVLSADLSTNSVRVDATRVPVFESLLGAPEQRYRTVTVKGIGAVSSGANPLGAPGGALPSQTVAAMERMLWLMNPNLLLRDVVVGARRVTDGGRTKLQGRNVDVLVVSDPVAPVHLTVASETGRILKLETATSHVLLRDTTIEAIYSDWQRVSTVEFPMFVQVSVAGMLLRRETRIAVVEAHAAPDEHFVLPEVQKAPSLDHEAYQFGATAHHIQEEFFEVAGLYYQESVPLRMTTLAPGIHHIQGTATPPLAGMAIEHNGGLLLLEAHTSPVVGDQLVALLEQRIPGRTISHVIQSHHHMDHSSGLRSLVANGATAVVGHGVRDWWEGVLSADSWLRPDTASAARVEANIIQLSHNGTWTTEGDSATITAHHIGGNRHASDMVVTVIRTDNHVFVYEADLYNAGFGFTMAVGGPRSLFDFMRQLGLIDGGCRSDVPLTIVPAHGVPTSLADALTELARIGEDVGCPSP